MNANTIQQQVLELAMNPTFVKQCASVAQQKGITAKEWNENKANILYMWATQVICSK
jgi:hypothetical protein